MLWRQVNPNFHDSVSLRLLKSILDDLLYIAIDQRLKMLVDSFNKRSKHLKDYLKNVLAAKPDFLNIVVDQLSDGDSNRRHVTHSKFTEVITIDFCRMATLRQLVMRKTKEAAMAA